MNVVGDALLLSLALIGGGWDLFTRRIPNWLTFPAALAGVVWNGYRGGWRGALLALGGLALGLAVFLPFFALGGMGAGDVKLMAAAGAMAGPQGLLVIFIYTGLLGGVLALLVAMARGRLGAALANTARLLGQLGRRRWEEARSMETATGRLPYGAVIAAGCALFLWIGPKSM